jgi:inner membrane protein
VGLLIARIAPQRALPQGAAICVVAANIPDLDIVTVVSPAAYLTYHRHLTHSLVAIPAMAALTVILVAAWNRLHGNRVSHNHPRWFARSWGLALLAAGSHVVLDLTNSYGVRLWLPFSNEWSSWDLIFVIDPIIWLILTVAAFVPWVLGRKRLTAACGLAMLVLYASLTLQIKANLAPRVVAWAIADESFVEWHLFPSPWTPWNWNVYLRTEAGESTAQWDALTSEPPVPMVFSPVEPGLVEQVLAVPLGRAYYYFALYPVFVMDGDDTVRLGDYRFVRNGELVFSCRFELDAAGRVTNSAFVF